MGRCNRRQVAYETAAIAEEVADQIRVGLGEVRHVSWCAACNAFHLTAEPAEDWADQAAAVRMQRQQQAVTRDSGRKYRSSFRYGQ